MKVYYQLNEFHRLPCAVVTSGTFDGVHAGHQALLRRVREKALACHGESVVLTFWPHPRLVVSPSDQPLQLLSTIEEKIELLAESGIDHLLILPFHREFSEMTAENYVQKILVDGIGTCQLVIGYDHRFGKNRSGDMAYLQAHQETFGFQVEEISKQEIDHLTISSTQIRQALQTGHLELATELLGRPYSFEGVVVKGRQLGRTIGFPTANVMVNEPYKLIPPHGVYAVEAFVRGDWYPGMMNIGTRPTVEGTGRTHEVHIFKFNQDIYGEHMKVRLHRWIRPERKFGSLPELQTQIHLDQDQIEQFFASM